MASINPINISVRLDWCVFNVKYKVWKKIPPYVIWNKKEWKKEMERLG